MVLLRNNRWLIPNKFNVPTVTVRPEVFPGMKTLLTLLKAFVPFTMVVELAAIINVSVIVLPSMFKPVTTTDNGEPVALTVGVTLRTLGTSGCVMPEVTVCEVLAPAVAARTAVEEPAATFLRVSV